MGRTIWPSQMSRARSSMASIVGNIVFLALSVQLRTNIQHWHQCSQKLTHDAASTGTCKLFGRQPYPRDLQRHEALAHMQGTEPQEGILAGYTGAAILTLDSKILREHSLTTLRYSWALGINVRSSGDAYH